MAQRKAKQKMRILQYIHDFGSITNAEALTEIAVGNFSARLSELKQDGYVFDKQIVHRKNRYGEDTYFCRYSNPRKISEV